MRRHGRRPPDPAGGSPTAPDRPLPEGADERELVERAMRGLLRGRALPDPAPRPILLRTTMPYDEFRHRRQTSR